MRSERRIVYLDQTDPLEAEEIRRLMVESYSEEARLLCIDYFPPLKRTPSQIMASNSRFVGFRIGSRLVAVAEIEGCGGRTPGIAAFAVHPEYFRRGVGGGILEYLIKNTGRGQLTVSTAAGNKPAVRLYKKYGFLETARWRTMEGIDMVTYTKKCGM